MEAKLLLCCSAWAAICAAIYSFLTDHDAELKSRESGLPMSQFLALYALRIMHYTIFLFFSLYAFVADVVRVYDIAVFLFIVMVYVQWMIIRTCILSMLEHHMLFGSLSLQDSLWTILTNVHQKYSHPWIESIGIPHDILYKQRKLALVALAVLLIRIYYSY